MRIVFIGFGILLICGCSKMTSQELLSESNFRFDRNGDCKVYLRHGSQRNYKTVNNFLQDKKLLVEDSDLLTSCLKVTDSAELFFMSDWENIRILNDRGSQRIEISERNSITCE